VVLIGWGVDWLPFLLTGCVTEGRTISPCSQERLSPLHTPWKQIRQNYHSVEQSTWIDVWCTYKCGKACYVKHCMCALSQWNTTDTVVWMAKMMMCIMGLRNFLHFVEINVFQVVWHMGCQYVNCK